MRHNMVGVDRIRTYISAVLTTASLAAPILQVLYIYTSRSTPRILFGARDGNRTHMRISPRWVLSPVRLPISPLSHNLIIAQFYNESTNFQTL